MAEEDDEDDAISMALHGNLQEVRAPRVGLLQKEAVSKSSDDGLDDYIKESEDGLSAALGPRWDARTLNENAERSTQALLKGIGDDATHSQCFTVRRKRLRSRSAESVEYCHH